jgi:hypothetical protein
MIGTAQPNVYGKDFISRAGNLGNVKQQDEQDSFSQKKDKDS